MKRKTITFICALIIGLVVLPFLNIIYNPDVISTKNLRARITSLYNMDIVETGVGYICYQFGLSISPDQVYVGKDGWLFLGENYSSPITTKLLGVNESNKATIKKIASNVASWNSFFRSHGVKDFKIIVGPDKETIYPELAPNWLKQSEGQILRELIKSDPDIYIDAFSQIGKAKHLSEIPLYFKTDTHWNLYGGAIAFNALADRLRLDVPGIKLEDRYHTSDFFLKKKEGGDLSRFLKISHLISDDEVEVRRQSLTSLKVTSVDYKTGRIITSGGFEPIEAPRSLTVYGTARALNNYKVLWLRDSFGTAMSPYMVRTFGNILQVHYGRITPPEIKRLVMNYKPDFVFITGVERDSLGKFFYTPM
ncbi:hypothetical protein ACN5L3_000827 [Cronobacter malonaticus]|uniref:alginate O-acetyltransferase AlgX-related protein n=3 Tax=Cronobacter malonaticus TaxID=413503 RepID=UPI000CFCD89C|nr:hypothetical protein [Cronobacter malonaticus]ELY2620681.1 hypothetical protein [Cronobacter malonaticus]ELY3622217.1 hypothetical protein [Cronobacter malonaticus]MDT3536095.1 hypothetical protein [Cronobacter malonaticus]NCH99298.1 hypothetical protein [Cronobacter malonaticus]